MADLLATVEDLRTFLGEDSTSLPNVEAELLLELATGAVQAAAGQDIVQRVDDTATLMGTVGSWLHLPQLPVTAVSTVTLDGAAVSDWKRFGARLWREAGWAASPYQPSTVEVVYTHGYAPGDEGIQLARQVTLMRAGQAFADPGGRATAFSVDDYREQYVQTSAEDLPTQLRAALRKKYGPRGRLVTVG